MPSDFFRAHLEVAGVTSEEVGTTAARAGITLYELTPHRATPEEVFMDLTRGAAEYGSGHTTRKAA